MWDLETRAIVTEMAGHQFGVSCLAWSPDSRALASAGFQHDGLVQAFDARTKQVYGTAKVSAKVFAAAWEDTTSFAVVGHRLVKVFALPDPPQAGVPLVQRAVQLGDHAGLCYVDVCHVPGRGLFAVSTSAMLVSIGAALPRAIDRWVHLKMDSAACVTRTAHGLLACGGAAGMVRLFTADFEYAGALPVLEPADDCVVPSVLAVQAGVATHTVCWYSDRSMAVVDVARGQVVHTQAGHAGLVWDVAARRGACTTLDDAPIVATCGADGVLRLWDAAQGACVHAQRVAPVDPALVAASCSMQGPDGSQSFLAMPDVETTRPRGEGGLRCLRYSDDGCHLAVGHRNGTVCAYDTHDWSCVASFAGAHEADVLSLDYSHPAHKNEPAYLATSSRDRAVRVYAASATGYTLLHALPGEHSSSVNCVKFAGDRLLSCGADKALVVRHIDATSGMVTREAQKSLQHGTLYDLCVLPDGGVVAAGQDKRINVYAGDTGKPLRNKLLGKQVGDLVRVSADGAGLYLAAATSKKQLLLIDAAKGTELIACDGHGDQITGVAFTPDQSRVVSASADGCLFVWKLNPARHHEIRTALVTMGTAPVPNVLARREAECTIADGVCLDTSVTAAPSWLRPVVAASADEAASPAACVASPGPAWLSRTAAAAPVVASPSRLFGGMDYGESLSLFLDMTQATTATLEWETCTVERVSRPTLEWEQVSVEVIQPATMETAHETTCSVRATAEVECEQVVCTRAFLERESRVVEETRAQLESEHTSVEHVMARLEMSSESRVHVRAWAEHEPADALCVWSASMVVEEVAVSTTAKIETPQAVRRQRKIQSEVEKTRERLAKMGMLPGATAAAKKKGNNTAPLADVSNTAPTSSVGNNKQRAVDEYRAALVRLEEAAQECSRLYRELEGDKNASAMRESYSQTMSRVTALMPGANTEAPGVPRDLLERFGSQLVDMVRAQLHNASEEQ